MLFQDYATLTSYLLPEPCVLHGSAQPYGDDQPGEEDWCQDHASQGTVTASYDQVPAFLYLLTLY